MPNPTHKTVSQGGNEALKVLPGRDGHEVHNGGIRICICDSFVGAKYIAYALGHMTNEQLRDAAKYSVEEYERVT